MFRIVLLLAAGSALGGCLSREAMQDLQAKTKARIEANRIQEVQLSEQQTAKIQALRPSAQITWLRAGRQDDGKTFVCHVSSPRKLLGAPTSSCGPEFLSPMDHMSGRQFTCWVNSLSWKIVVPGDLIPLSGFGPRSTVFEIRRRPGQRVRAMRRRGRTAISM
jgi:hypothetical protein